MQFSSNIWQIPITNFGVTSFKTAQSQVVKLEPPGENRGVLAEKGQVAVPAGADAAGQS
jgi:hypothetical protein